MKDSYPPVYKALHRIYDTHRRRYPWNPNSEQMCCMWSTDDPPDILEGTPPLNDMEDAFGIRIDEDSGVELYDMNLDEAAKKIMEMKARESQQ